MELSTPSAVRVVNRQLQLSMHWSCIHRSLIANFQWYYISTSLHSTCGSYLKREMKVVKGLQQLNYYLVSLIHQNLYCIYDMIIYFWFCAQIMIFAQILFFQSYQFCYWDEGLFLAFSQKKLFSKMCAKMFENLREYVNTLKREYKKNQELGLQEWQSQPESTGTIRSSCLPWISHQWILCHHLIWGARSIELHSYHIVLHYPIAYILVDFT